MDFTYASTWLEMVIVIMAVTFAVGFAAVIILHAAFGILDNGDDE